MASAGQMSARYASCGSEDDTRRIKDEIETDDPHIYEHIDKSIHSTMHQAQRTATKQAATIGFHIAINLLIFFPVQEDIGVLSAIILAVTMTVAAIYFVFRKAQGAPSAYLVLLCGCLLYLAGGALVFFGDTLNEKLKVTQAQEKNFFAFLGFLESLFGIYIVFFLLGDRCCFAPLKRQGRLPFLVSSSLCFWAALLVPCVIQYDGIRCLYGNAVFSASGVIGCYFVPAYGIWSSAQAWGVQPRW